MYMKPDDDVAERTKEDEKRSRKAIPLHRSPAVFAALSSIGEAARGGNLTSIASSVTTNGDFSSSTAECSAFVKTVGPIRSKIHKRTQRPAPYSPQKPHTLTSRDLPDQPPKVVVGNVKTTSSWHQLLYQTGDQSSDDNLSITKSFSAPCDLSSSGQEELQNVNIAENKLHSYAIKTLAKAADGDRSIDVTENLPPAVRDAQTDSAATSSSHNDPPSSTSRICSFRRLNIPTVPLIRRDILLQRHIRESLVKHGVCVIDGFLGQELTSKIASEVRDLHTAGKCVKGELLSEIGGREGVRGDLIAWVDGSEPGCESIGVFCRKLDSIIASGSGVTSLYNICGGTKAMASRYPGNGTRYKLHVDNPAKDGRCLTCIFYLNEQWDSRTMGGSLRLHSQMSGKTANISPTFDRIAIFYSDNRNPHEVLPTYTDRYAVTVWYFDREERASALERMEESARSSETREKKREIETPESTV